MSESASDLLCLFAAAFVATIGAVHDVRTRRIPNSLTLPGIVFGLLLHLLLGGWRQLGASVWAGIVCGLVFLAFYLAGGMGGGDVKLLAGVGAWTGLLGAFDCLMVGSVLGTVYAARLLILKRAKRGDAIPFGPFLAAGAILNLFWLLPLGWPLV